MSSINVNTIKSRLGGPPTLPSGVVVSAAATFSNDVSIGGTLTYEDVTNVDAVGLITARNGIKFGVAGVGGTIRANGDTTLAGVVTATTFVGNLTGNPTGSAAGLTNIPGGQITGALAAVDGSALTGIANTANVNTAGLNVIGVATVGGDVSIADKIIHTGDTNTAIRFPSADNISFEAGGVERLRIDNVTGNQVVARDTTASILRVENSTAAASQVAMIDLAPANSLSGVQLKGTSEEDYSTGANRTAFFTVDVRKDGTFSERLRITSGGGFSFNNGQLVERVEITAGKLSANQDIDLADGMVHYFTTQESTTATPNIRINSSTTLNSAMDAGDVVTVTLITTAAAAGYSAQLTIDGNAVTEEWVGGSAPSAGSSDGLDIYTYTIICIHATNTGDSGFKVIANLTNATN